MIDYEHMSAAGDSVIAPEALMEGERFERFQATAAAAKAHGALVIGQVNHPGRQIPSKMAKESISASAVQLSESISHSKSGSAKAYRSHSSAEPHAGMTFPPTRAATTDEIARIVDAFAHAAEFLEAAGFDGIELHAAHGYLLAQFLSPTTNKRTDAYGGIITNRLRIVSEVCAAVRARTSPSFILAIKLNSVEFQAEGLTTADAAELVAALQRAGVDYLELSGGTYENFGFERRKNSTRSREAFFLEFAERVVPALGPADKRRTKVFITGGLRSAGAMVEALDVVDGVGIARPAVQEPSLALSLLAGQVTGAIKALPPFETDFAMSGFGAWSQMRAIGKGYEPFDLGDAEVTGQFLKDVRSWFTETAKDGGKLTKFGYPDYTGELRPHLAN